MKLSKYNYLFALSTGEKAVFNTFSGAIAILDDKEEKFLRNFSVNHIDPYIFKEFIKMGFVIEDEIDELSIIDHDRIRSTYCTTATFRIFVTTLCNAECYYCYEKANVNVTKTNMTMATAQKVVDFIISQIRKDEPFRIEWFGGEPLLNGEVISFITKSLDEAGYVNGIYSLITNGILLHNYDISIIKNEWKISRIQISFDGFDETYNEVKKIRGFNNPFLQVCENIKYLAVNEVQITIRMNLSNNLEDLYKLIDFFKDKYKKYHNIKYYVYPIFDGNKEVSAQTLEQIVSLNNALISHNLMSISEIYLLGYKTSRCFATNYKGFTIDSIGNLYKCSHAMKEIDKIGSVDIYNPYHYSKLLFEGITLREKCLDCVFLPLCQGGCKASELEKAQTSHCFLWKNKINDILESIIKGEGAYYENYKK